MVEWSIAAVLKTVEARASGGSNPSLCAKQKGRHAPSFFVWCRKKLEEAPHFQGFARGAKRDCVFLFSIFASDDALP